MKWTVEQWHKRFVQQASWTHSLRRYLYDQIAIRPDSLILDVGCGTGALSSDFNSFQDVSLFGIDIDFPRLAFARDHERGARYLNADANFLPFKDGYFDFVICHYFLLWLSDPLNVLKELARVIKPGGVVLAIAEPDYTHRIDAPDDLVALGRAQTQSLEAQGANPAIGRSLPHLFSLAGFHDIQFGSSGFQSHMGELPANWDLEWQVLEHDLHDLVPGDEIARTKKMDQAAWLNGSRVLWVPTFYAFGTKG
jgi:SAM-dependent methyltransferase